MVSTPSLISFELEVPGLAFFRTFAQIHGSDYPAEFTVVVERDGKVLCQERRVVDPKSPGDAYGGAEFCIPLLARSTKKTIIRLGVSGGAPEAKVMWGNPSLLSRASTFNRAASDGSGLRLYLASRLSLFLADPNRVLKCPSPTSPKVSIIIPTYNDASLLLACVESILAHCRDLSYQLVIVDDCSSDQVPQLLSRLEGAVHKRNETNLDFIKTCNRGAALASGDFLVFLNTDTTVTSGWLQELLATFDNDSELGAVGSKLVRPDGSLQEAGGFYYRDGTAGGYGRNCDPRASEFNYLRDVDYCSGASLMVKSELFRQLGGFDERYLPAYYEDLDLCTAVWAAGYSVKYQPRSLVFHQEYATNGEGRATKLCQQNRPVFAKKWASLLPFQAVPGDVYRARERGTATRVLMIDDTVPAERLGCGFPRTLAILGSLVNLGFKVTYLPATDSKERQPETDRLQRAGVEVLNGLLPKNHRQLFEDRAGLYDTVLVSRPHNAARFRVLIREHFPQARLVYDAEALYATRDILRAERQGIEISHERRLQFFKKELEYIRGADATIAVTEREKRLIKSYVPDARIAVLGTVVEPYKPAPFDGRRDLLFVGTLNEERNWPNVDAVTHFATKVFPLIQSRMPDCRLLIVGSDPAPCVWKLQSNSIEILPNVEDLEPLYQSAKVFVAPMNICAGLQLKVVEALSRGLPCVVNVVAQADFVMGKEVMVAESDPHFAELVEQVYSDPLLWGTLQQGGLGWIQQHCSERHAKQVLSNILEGESL